MMSSATPCQITRLLLEKQGCLEFKELSQIIKKGNGVSDKDLIGIISANSQFILAEDGNKGGSGSVCSPNTLVIAKTHLRVCPDDPDQCKSCEHLQICKYFVCGTCKFGNKCRMSHDVKSIHNTSLLKKVGLQDLKEKELFQLLLQNDPSLLPQVCIHYNKGNGEHGNCKYPTSCTNLHACQYFLQDNCKFGAACKRAHTFDTNSMKILSHGLGEDEIRGFLKTYKNSFLISCYKGKPAQRVETVKPALSTNQPNSGAVCEAEKSEEICLYFIRRGCTFKEKCARVHHHLPYKWQYLRSGTWKDFPNGEDIERAYSDPANDQSKGLTQVNFNSMTYDGMRVRRLSTASSVNKPPHFILTTNWLWYWKNEKGRWIEYGCGEDAKRKALVTSKTLEDVYLKDPKEKLPFRSESHEYILNFEGMYQQNIKNNTRRDIRRRPRFVPAEEVERKLKSSESCSLSLMDVPDYWEKEALPNFTYKLITLSTSTDEYRKVESLFKATMHSSRIHNIQRLQNPSLWKVFQWQKEQMKEKSEGGDVNERYLFHGTDSTLKEAICDQNFDWRVCGKNGTSYGKGSYFARDAAYSNKYTKTKGGTKMMFVALVLVGEFIKGSISYARPPQKKHKPGFYDSCVDKESDPSIFVIFEKYQVYPEYVIEYS